MNESTLSASRTISVRILTTALFCALPFLSPSLPGAQQRLADLQPFDVEPVNPGSFVTPAKVAPLTVRGHVSSSVVQFVAQSRVRYHIPPRSVSFAGILIYRTDPADSTSLDSSLFNRVRVVFYLDGTKAFESFFDGETPPLAFSLSVLDGKVLTIQSDDQFGVDSFSIADGEFSSLNLPLESSDVLRPGENAANVAPQAEQFFFHVYRPGSEVPIHLNVEAGIRTTRGLVSFVPEQGQGTPTTELIDFKLTRSTAAGRNILEGIWRVPLQLGPGLLRFSVHTSAAEPYSRQIRVAIIPPNESAAGEENLFGIHISESGFPTLQDDFAYLWGASWARMFIRWPVSEPTPGHYDFSRAQHIIETYRAQKLSVLAVLGEDSPSWAGPPRKAYGEPWKLYVAAATSQFAPSVRAWEIFNEIDVKFHEDFQKDRGDLDLELLKEAIATVRQQDPRGLIICCSTGTADWLAYDERLLQAGALAGVDGISLHPYRAIAPEARQGFFSYPEELFALDSLLRVHGMEKPSWSTESNWILGAKNGPYVTAPYLNEHTQAVYIVRSSLLSISRNTPYFVHMPFFYSARPQLHLDTLAAYAQMTRWFSGVTQVRATQTKRGITSVFGKRKGKLRGAVWSSVGDTWVDFGPGFEVKLYDFYGNPLPAGDSGVRLSSTPLYFQGDEGSGDLYSVRKEANPVVTTRLRPITGWARSPDSQYTVDKDSLRIVSKVSQYANQLVSEPIPAQPHSCYIFAMEVQLLRGAISVVAVNAANSSEHTDNAIPLYQVDRNWHAAEYAFHNAAAGPFRIVIQDGNSAGPAISEFVVRNPAIRKCSDASN